MREVPTLLRRAQAIAGEATQPACEPPGHAPGGERRSAAAVRDERSPSERLTVPAARRTIAPPCSRSSSGATGASRDPGLQVPHQELDLVPHLSVAQNVFLGHERKRGPLLNRAAMHSETEALFARLGNEGISPTASVTTAAPGITIPVVASTWQVALHWALRTCSSRWYTNRTFPQMLFGSMREMIGKP